MVDIAPTIKDVAKYAGVSIATVSKYLNGGNVLEKNKILIEQAIDALDFKVNEIARGLKTNRTMTIGVVMPTFENLFFATIVSKVEDVLLQNGYSTIVCDYREDKKLEGEKIDFLINKMVDGIIAMPLESSGIHIKKALDNNVPVVLVDRPLKDIQCDVVLVDNLNASYNATEQLIIRGHKRIGIICGPQGIYTAQERLNGYLRVHQDYSMQIDEDLIKQGDYQMESGYLLLNELMEMENPPTAVYVTNYEMTLGAIMAVNEKNIRVPDQLSLIGFDNLQLAKIVRPPLSTVVQPMRQIGETAAGILLKRLKGDMSNFPTMYRLKTKVVIKESVGKI